MGGWFAPGLQACGTPTLEICYLLVVKQRPLDSNIRQISSFIATVVDC